MCSFPPPSQNVSVFCHRWASITVSKAFKEAAVNRNLNAVVHLRWPVLSSKLESVFLAFLFFLFSVWRLKPMSLGANYQWQLPAWGQTAALHKPLTISSEADTCFLFLILYYLCYCCFRYFSQYNISESHSRSD